MDEADKIYLELLAKIKKENKRKDWLYAKSNWNF